jgi:hypothetical protein
MCKHRSNYNKWLNKNGSSNTVFTLFDKYGVENCKIELLENYPCANKSELEAREGHHQRETVCINKNIAGRTTKQYNDDHREYRKAYYTEHRSDILEKARTYNKNHQQQISQKKKEYSELNKDTIASKKKEYYENNKNLWTARNASVTCECGCQVTLTCKARHMRTAKHQRMMNQLPQEEAMLQDSADKGAIDV